MALQTEAIDNRLEGLKQDDRRMIFDSKLRAFQMDSKAPLLAGNRAAKLSRKAEPEYPVDQMVALLEELSRRIDGLEKKDRSLADEIRRRARQDRRWRSILTACGLAGSAFLVANWVMHWF